MMAQIKTFLANKRAATAIEYGLIAALVAIAAVTAMNGLGNQLKSSFNSTSSVMQAAS